MAQDKRKKIRQENLKKKYGFLEKKLPENYNIDYIVTSDLNWVIKIWSRSVLFSKSLFPLLNELESNKLGWLISVEDNKPVIRINNFQNS